MRRLLGSLTSMGEVDPRRRIGGVRLVYMPFPTHTRTSVGTGQIPAWNHWHGELVDDAFTLACEFMVPEGVIVATCRGEHFHSVAAVALDSGLRLLRVLYLRTPTFTFASDGDYTDVVGIGHSQIPALYKPFSCNDHCCFVFYQVGTLLILIFARGQ